MRGLKLVGRRVQADGYGLTPQFRIFDSLIIMDILLDMKLHALSFVTLATLLLSGCQTPPPPGATAHFDLRRHVAETEALRSRELQRARGSLRAGRLWKVTRVPGGEPPAYCVAVRFPFKAGGRRAVPTAEARNEMAASGPSVAAPAGRAWVPSCGICWQFSRNPCQMLLSHSTQPPDLTRPMKTFALLLAFLPWALHAGDKYSDIMLKDGTVLKDAEVTAITARGVKVTHQDGGGLITLAQLPPHLQKKYSRGIAVQQAAAKQKAEERENLTTPQHQNAVARVTAEGAPEPAGKILAGLSPEDVYLNFEKQGFATEKSLGSEQCEWISRQNDGASDMNVTTTGPAATQVSVITGNCINLKGAADSTGAKALLSCLASIRYENAEPVKAAQWVKDNIDTDNAKTTIAGVRFHIMARPAAPAVRMLRIVCPK